MFFNVFGACPLTLWSPPALVLLLAALLLLGSLAYWQLVVAEGVHLGQRVVSLLYDGTAHRYDAIKCFNSDDEDLFLGAPLAQALRLATPLVLDVACGTGRLPRTLLSQPEFHGKVVGLDASRRMLAKAGQLLGDGVPLIWQVAERLPFDDASFDAVTCLEALEFMPSAPRALAEIGRVLRPGGLLLTTNRVGPAARWLPGHTLSTPALEQLLASLGFEQVRAQIWQVEYDLVWARRGGSEGGKREHAYGLAAILCCPHCRTRLGRVAGAWRCGACERIYPVAPDDIIEMLNR
ncbi:MAG: class I SAM-dependent methyltransferase [Thermoflexales bacterium]|nr:class I SAM-dependent methyltransferase [Thermoflexales bacterium]